MSFCRAFTVMPARAMATKVPQSVAKVEEGNIKMSERAEYARDKNTRDKYLHPLLTPPPRSPKTPEDFMHPERLGHWVPLGFDYTNPVKDKYQFHEFTFFLFTGGLFCAFAFAYAPDFKYREWARREAYLRTTKREALGLPLIDPDVVDRDRIVLPTEEELGDFEVTQ